MQAKQIKIAEAQAEILEWSQRNFGTFVDVQRFINLSSFLGMVEELGELAHAILKQAQGIRGTKEEHDEAIDDAIADLMVFTLDFAGRNNKDLESIFNRVWAKVKERDWKKNSVTGGTEVVGTAISEAPKSYSVPVIRDLPHDNLTAEQVFGKKVADEQKAATEQFIHDHPDAKIVDVEFPAEEGEKD